MLYRLELSSPPLVDDTTEPLGAPIPDEPDATAAELRVCNWAEGSNLGVTNLPFLEQLIGTVRTELQIS